MAKNERGRAPRDRKRPWFPPPPCTPEPPKHPPPPRPAAPACTTGPDAFEVIRRLGRKKK